MTEFLIPITVNALPSISELQGKQGMFILPDGSININRKDGSWMHINKQSDHAGVLKTTDPISVQPGVAKWYWAGTGTYSNVGPGITIDKVGIISYDGVKWSFVNIDLPNTKLKTWTAGSYTMGEQVVFSDFSIYEASSNISSADVPGVSEKWKKIVGSIVDYYNEVKSVLNHFITATKKEDAEIIMPLSGEVSGSYLNSGLNQVTASYAAHGDITMAELAGYDEIIIRGDTLSIGAGCLYLAKKVGSTWTNIKLGGNNSEFRIAIDKAADKYVYSRFLGTSEIPTKTLFYKSKTVSDVKHDSVYEAINAAVNGRNVYRPEDFGAEPLDPANPDAGKDCTEAFNSMFQKMFVTDQFAASYKVIMSGVYRIGGEPKYQNNRSQLDIPFDADVNWKFKTIVFEGLTRPSLTDRGEHMVMNPLLGCGFYSSYIYTGSDYKSIIYQKAGNNFGLKIGHIFFDNICFYTKTHDANNNSIVNNMGGCDLSNLASVGFTDVYVSATTAGLNHTAPNANSIGFALPNSNNMASVYGNSLKVMGFGVGAFLTEHLNLNHLIAVFNRDGIQIKNTYPINIGNATLEHNLCHMSMYPDSAVNFGVFQTEDINNSQYWFNRTGNMIKGSSTSRCTMSQVMCHFWGGTKVPLSYDSVVKIRYLMDENGNSKLA